MASIDKAAIVFSIAIAAIGAGFAFVGDSVDFISVPVATTTPSITPSDVSETNEDPFAELADKVRNDALQADDAMDDSMMDDAMDDSVTEAMVDDIINDTMMEDMEDTMMMDDTMEDTMDDTMEDTMMMDDTMEDTMMEDTMEESSGPTTHTVDIPVGTSVVGCEVNNECYLPPEITVNVGDTVEWINLDTAAHTVTSGNIQTGITNVFDSGLVLGGASYSFTFEESGTYEYFCIVHPWMIGSVTVN